MSVSGHDYFFQSEQDNWTWRCGEKELKGLPRPMQYSDFQLQNAAGVLMILEKIQRDYPVTEEAIKQGLSSFRLNGRMQFIPGEVQKILDVAHNRESVRALVKNLKAIPCPGKTHFLIGMLKDKDHLEFFRELSQVADSWNIVTLDQERGCEAELLVSYLARLGIINNVSAFANVGEALEKLKETAIQGDRIIITGSFLTVGAALRHLT